MWMNDSYGTGDFSLPLIDEPITQEIRYNNRSLFIIRDRSSDLYVGMEVVEMF